MNKSAIKRLHQLEERTMPDRLASMPIRPTLGQTTGSSEQHVPPINRQDSVHVQRSRLHLSGLVVLRSPRPHRGDSSTSARPHTYESCAVIEVTSCDVTRSSRARSDSIAHPHRHGGTETQRNTRAQRRMHSRRCIVAGARARSQLPGCRGERF